MQIKLLIENFDDIEEKDFSVIYLKSSSSISSWIIDYYFTEIFSKQIQIMNKSVQPKNIIGSYDMWMIYQGIQSTLSVRDFWNLCKNKFKQIQNDFILENYNNYLNRCGLIDIIDLIHQCQFDLMIQTIIFSIKNIKNDMDRLVLEYLVQLPSTSCGIYDRKTKLTTIKTPEDLLKLIDNEKPSAEEANNSKVSFTAGHSVLNDFLMYRMI
jgi:hypothetical protein